MIQKTRNLDAASGERLQLALTRLVALDQQAERDKLHGRVGVELHYHEGVASYVREIQETTYK